METKTKEIIEATIEEQNENLPAIQKHLANWIFLIELPLSTLELQHKRS